MNFRIFNNTPDLSWFSLKSFIKIFWFVEREDNSLKRESDAAHSGENIISGVQMRARDLEIYKRNPIINQVMLYI